MATENTAMTAASRPNDCAIMGEIVTIKNVKQKFPQYQYLRYSRNTVLGALLVRML